MGLRTNTIFAFAVLFSMATLLGQRDSGQSMEERQRIIATALFEHKDYKPPTELKELLESIKISFTRVKSLNDWMNVYIESQPEGKVKEVRDFSAAKMQADSVIFLKRIETVELAKQTSSRELLPLWRVYDELANVERDAVHMLYMDHREAGEMRFKEAIFLSIVVLPAQRIQLKKIIEDRISSLEAKTKQTKNRK